MPAKPTRKQLRCLRILAQHKGETFATPRTRAGASRQIARLKSRRSSPRVERAQERDEVTRGLQQSGPASAVRADEIAGYGASARWRGRES